MQVKFFAQIKKQYSVENGKIDVNIYRPDAQVWIEFETGEQAQNFEVWWKKEGQELFEKSED